MLSPSMGLATRTPTAGKLVLRCMMLCMSMIYMVQADLPVHCLPEEGAGTWEFTVGPSNNTKNVDCTHDFQVSRKFQVELVEPNIVRNATGAIGTYTMVYDEGFEAIFHGAKYFANFWWSKSDNGTFFSHCDATGNGWFHSPDGSNWGCFKATRVLREGQQPRKEKTIDHKHNDPTPEGRMEVLRGKKKLEVPLMTAQNHRRLESSLTAKYHVDTELVAAINQQQSSWTATTYAQFEGMTMEQIRAMVGVEAVTPSNLPVTRANQDARPDSVKYAGLPDNWDWRNVKGQNYVSPVRDQNVGVASCGSCYTFSALASIESRIQILSKNKLKPLLSPQHVIACSNYSQGCQGGFPYLVGKFGQDFGLVEESAMKYEGKNLACPRSLANPGREAVTISDYSFVGGYFGNSSEVSMMWEIMTNGPITCSVDAKDTLIMYKSGIYSHPSKVKRGGAATRWEQANHSLLCLGWGVDDKTKEKFWIAKNSWGTKWGEEGFVRIRRGVDECAIESEGVAFTPKVTGLF